jgi:hypothetical protein
MTKAVLISYDLNKPGQDYDDLIEKIKSLGTWWHNLDSTWIVKTSQPAKTVRDTLKPLLDENDELLVVDITGTSAAWWGFNERGSKWLKDNIWA